MIPGLFGLGNPPNYSSNLERNLSRFGYSKITLIWQPLLRGNYWKDC